VIECGCKIVNLPHVAGAERSSEREIEFCAIHAPKDDPVFLQARKMLKLLTQLPKDELETEAWMKKRQAVLDAAKGK